jgi:zinc protease
MTGHAIFCLAFVFLALEPMHALGPAVVENRLGNGARVLVSEQRNLPLIVIGIMVDAGSRWDPPGRAGVANLTADLLTEGTKRRSAATIKEEIDGLGGYLSVNADADYAVLQLRVLKSDVAHGVDLLSDILLRPALADAELTRRKEAVLAQIRSQRDDPTSVAQIAFQEAIFGSGPYGHPVEGTERTVSEISRADVQAFYSRYYGPAGATIVVVGDISAAEAQLLFAESLATWKGTDVTRPVSSVVLASEAKQVRIDKPVTQAAIVLGHRGVARSNPDYETLSVMNYILGGGGFSSRLMDSIRTKGGLAYSVSSFYSVNKEAGVFEIVMQTKNASVADAIGRARAEVQRLRDGGVTDAEVDEAKRYLTGSFALRLDSMSEIASFIGQVTAFGLGLDYADRYIERINAVSIADVQRVAQAYLHPDQLTEVIVADLSQATLPPP